MIILGLKIILYKYTPSILKTKNAKIGANHKKAHHFFNEAINNPNQKI